MNNKKLKKNFEINSSLFTKKADTPKDVRKILICYYAFKEVGFTDVAVFVDSECLDFKSIEIGIESGFKNIAYNGCLDLLACCFGKTHYNVARAVFALRE